MQPKTEPPDWAEKMYPVFAVAQPWDPDNDIALVQDLTDVEQVVRNGTWLEERLFKLTKTGRISKDEYEQLKARFYTSRSP